jgi:NAD(P)-dependent dehydrogenase (short-subunit alcohol dehydrogenase family)
VSFTERPEIVLVTGARRGIGAAILVGLAQPGRTLILHTQRASDAAEAAVVAARARDRGALVEVVVSDLAIVGETTAFIRALVSKHGGVDILINNAARSSYVAVSDVTAEEWEATLNVNLRAPFFLAQTALEGMVQRRWGRVVNVTSITESLGGPSGVAYVASKGGLVALTRALARSIRVEGVTVNAVSPGAILTEQEYEYVSVNQRAASDEYVLRQQSVPRRLVPQDVVSAVRFLVDPGSNSVTGQVIEVNGGWVFR